MTNGWPANEGPSAVDDRDFPRDDNLRLVLSADHEDFLVGEIRQYLNATLFMVGLWLLIAALFATSAGGGSMWFEGLLLFGIFGFPFGVVFLLRNAVRVRRVAAAHAGHVDFLRSYNRRPQLDPADVARRADRVAMVSLAGAAAVALASLAALAWRLFA